MDFDAFDLGGLDVYGDDLSAMNYPLSSEPRPTKLAELQPLDPDFTCLGCVRHPGVPMILCNRPVAQHYRQSAQTLLTEILSSDKFGDELQDNIQYLAHLCLCRVHQDEAYWFAKRWIVSLHIARGVFNLTACETKEETPTPTSSKRKPRVPVCTHTAIRRPVEEECLICQDVLDPTNDQLLWCKNGCGRSYHQSCFFQWERHTAGPCGHTLPLKCSLCRTEWVWAACRCDQNVPTEVEFETMLAASKKDEDVEQATAAAEEGGDKSGTAPVAAGSTGKVNLLWGCAGV